MGRQAYPRYEELVRDPIVCPRYDPKANQDEIKRALKEIDERIAKE